MKRAGRDRQPTRGFPPQIERDRIDGLVIRETMQGLHVITKAITTAGTLGRPRRDGNRSANISSENNSPRWAARNANTLSHFNK